MATAKKLPSGNWRIQVLIDGKRKSFTAPTKREAERMAAQYSAEADSKSVPSVTLNAAIDAYIQKRENVLSPSTIRGYRIVQRGAFARIGALPLADLSDRTILQQYVNDAALRYSQKSLKNQLGVISMVLHDHGFTMPENVNIGANKSTGIAVPTKAECERLLAALKGTSIECQALLALTCSLTQSEIGALTPAHIHGDRVDVRGARVPDEHNVLVVKPTNKTDTRRRTIIMPPYLAALVAKHAEGLKNDALLFPQRPSETLSALKRICRQNDMPEYTMHSLRHAFAAWAHEMKVPDQYIMAAGGWSSPHVMKRVYQYAFADEADKVKKDINASFEAIIAHENAHNAE